MYIVVVGIFCEECVRVICIRLLYGVLGDVVSLLVIEIGGRGFGVVRITICGFGLFLVFRNFI